MIYRLIGTYNYLSEKQIVQQKKREKRNRAKLKRQNIMQQQKIVPNEISIEKLRSNTSKRKSIMNDKKIKATLENYYEDINCDDKSRELLNEAFRGKKLIEIQNVS